MQAVEPLVSLSDPDGPSFADEINARHNKIVALGKTALAEAIRIGELLVANRQAVRHGDWLKWLKKNIVFNERTAQRYIACFDNRERLLKNDTLSYLADAYALLAKKTEHEARRASSEKPAPEAAQSEPKPAAKQKPNSVDDEIPTAPVENDEAIWRRGLLERALKATALAQYDDWSRFTFDQELGDAAAQAADVWIELTNYLRSRIEPLSSDDNVPF
jgi:predicted component of type VI protein secretion system